MNKIEFTKDFAAYKKGDQTDTLSNTLASRLVHVRKVAKYVKGKKAVKKSKEE